MHIFIIYLLLGIIFINSVTLARELDLQVEGGGVWFSKNDGRICDLVHTQAPGTS